MAHYGHLSIIVHQNLEGIEMATNPFTSARAPLEMQGLAPDLAAEQAQILRQQKMAEMLRARSLEGSRPTEMVSGWAVKQSPLEGINKIAQGLLGGYMQKEGDRAQGELVSKQNEQLIKGLNDYQSALQGAPAKEAIAPATPMDDEGNVMPSVSAQPAVPGNRQAALASLLRSGDPRLQQMGMQQMMAKPESMFSKIDPKDYTAESVKQFAATNDFGVLVPVRKRDFVNGQAVDPYAVSPGTVIAPQVNRATDLLVPDASGNFVPNAPLVGLKKDIGKASAPSITTKVDVKTGESLGKEVGGIMKEASESATAAANQIGIAQRIQQAVDGNKLFTGTGANVKMSIAQIGDTLGVTGKDTQEKIANTRQTIQSLAQLTLEGRKQMRGQGAVTESESKLAERAMSGDISLTPIEIKVLANAAERSGKSIYGNYERKFNQLKSDPSTAQLAPYYEAQPMPAPAAPSSGGFRILGVR